MPLGSQLVGPLPNPDCASLRILTGVCVTPSLLGVVCPAPSYSFEGPRSKMSVAQAWTRVSGREASLRPINLTDSFRLSVSSIAIPRNQT